MSKYSLDFKVKLINEYFSGESGGMNLVARKYGIPDSTLVNWINWYEAEGIEGLSKKLSNKKYASEFKLSVIQYRKINETSLRETADEFGLTNASMIHSWEKAYRERGFDGLQSKRGRPPKDMNKDENLIENPLNETEREELIRLREENRLLKMKDIYEKKLSALLLEEELEARKKQRYF